MNFFENSLKILAVTIPLLLFVCLLSIAIFERVRHAKSIKHAIEEQNKNFREESERTRDALQREIFAFRNELATGNEARARTLNEILATNRNETAKTFSEIRESLEKATTRLREENSRKLDEMRAVVDEKLQTTLEKRISESFKLVSARLESVNKSLGEMQTVATSVGDLKRVLTNVKTRGTWGEVQLGALLENMLTPEQFERNVKPSPRSEAIVEFAIKLPCGAENDNKPIFLPLDSKFPIEAYERIVAASEKADAGAVEAAGTQLGKVVETCARNIRDKYIKPPHTTNFAILFLPTEGLFAEVLRRPGLAEKIQRELRVLIAGPTTLSALLNSLQMGFRTLAIQKNSAEIAKTLATVKNEFSRFGDLLAKVGKTLHDAQNTIEATANRHRIAMNKLTKVETLDTGTPSDTREDD